MMRFGVPRLARVRHRFAGPLLHFSRDRSQQIGEGRFGTNLVLRVTGTSKLTTLAPQKRGRRVVVTQRDTDLKELQRNQAIAVVYITAGKDSVLLAGVAQPAGDK